MTIEVAQENPGSPKRSYILFSGGSFFARVMKWVTLTVITLGIYRFWAMTGLRRSLWSATHLEGDHLRYHGTGKELFIGFLIALAILIPFYALGFGLQFMGLIATIIGFAIMFVVGFLLTPYALFRRRRYLLTRTSWRGIRFHMQGSAWRYVGAWLFWTILSVITLGIALPWRMAKLDRMLAEVSYFGNQQFSYSATPKNYFDALLPAYALVVVLFIPIALIGPSVFAAAIIAPMLTFFTWPYIAADIFRLQVNSTKIGDAGFESHIGASKFYGAYIIHAVIVGVGVAIVGAIGTLLTLTIGVQIEPESGFFSLAFLPVFALYYGVLLFANMMVLQVMLFEWKMSSMVVINAHSVKDAIAAGDLENAVGMGLADTLDAGFEVI
ncbi:MULTISPECIES: DUF898 family protein [unclassified Pseudovibrio]|uniref:DUF898 family protein n=1 Tax=unclassified Pseudovibrio TaxID=2627060 RepID=UPI0007AE4152|nr:MULTISPECIES: DUF898 family protein [unclassified Pseudovibrio]KZL03292.1 hypothetical protein PsW74_00718 [Pseudovibrio sp. W74]KZL12254.1 hypothetical protein PsAD14_00421 [Pseudovibrio sp. Ad14]